MLFLKEFLNNDPRLPYIIRETNKDNMNSLIQTIFHLAKKARREGILALQDDMEDFHPDYMSDKLIEFIQKIFSLLIDAQEENIIKNIAKNYISATPFNYDETIQAILWTNGIIMIQQGTNPGITYQYLASMLGINIIPDCEDEQYVSIYEYKKN
jgi:flagellar motor component MotA